MLLLGYDIGSSSVKASLIDGENGICLKSAFSPKKEMSITAKKSGWAEQDPAAWWDNLKKATKELFESNSKWKNDVKAIGISYQMHGLVVVDKDFKPLRPSIIWCDSRAVQYGNAAFKTLGEESCLECLLNSPGNFTASKLKWVKENEPDIYEKAHKIMLPGDYIAYKLTGELTTTVSGLSEGIFWDFRNEKMADFLLEHYGFDKKLIPSIVPTFSEQGKLTAGTAKELDLPQDITVAYRAGDQPNNAFSLNVLNPGEIAATAGTSGVVYGVSEEVKYDPESRVNTFAHVNHTSQSKRLGVLLCINGTGILYSWLKSNLGLHQSSYEELNNLAAQSPIGSNDLFILPFGNGAERMLNNKDVGCSVNHLNFNVHKNSDMIRAGQEGIVFSFKYGMDIMNNIGIDPSIIRAGRANMFLSPVFRETLAGTTNATIELYDTDGSQGAAKGAGVGINYYASFQDAFETLNKLAVIEPDQAKLSQYGEAYDKWSEYLNNAIK